MVSVGAVITLSINKSSGGNGLSLDSIDFIGSCKSIFKEKTSCTEYYKGVIPEETRKELCAKIGDPNYLGVNHSIVSTEWSEGGCPKENVVGVCTTWNIKSPGDKVKAYSYNPVTEEEAREKCESSIKIYNGSVGWEFSTTNF